MSIQILNELNPEQTQAVTHKTGPLLIIAGAGTGKTTVITRRIAWLVNEGLAKTNEILALTFTDKAAKSMQEKVDVLVPYGYVDIWISTFHAFGDRLLRENALELGITPDFKVLTRPEAAVFFREHLFEFNLSYYRPLSDPTRFIEALLDVFSRAKDEDINWRDYREFALGLERKAKENSGDLALQEEAVKHKEIAESFARYQELLLKEGKIDFGNQFYLALELLRKHPSVLRRYQEQFKYILVDEFQDTNFAQFQLIKLLAGKQRNVTCSADDDQSIYRWRGAAYSNIMNFVNEYPDAAKIAIIQNYRSTQVILDSAYQLIQHNNPERFEVKSGINKKLVSQNKNGPAIKHLHFDTLSTEADNAAKIISAKVKSGEFRYSDFAILVRANNDAEPFLRGLNMLSIPWRFSGNQGLYSQPEVRLCISFLRVMANIHDSLSLYYLTISEIYLLAPEDLSSAMHLAKRRNRGLYFLLDNLDNEPEIAFNLSDEIKEKIRVLILDIKKFLKLSAELTSGRLLYQFLTDAGLLKNLISKPSVASEEKLMNLAKFFDLVHNYETIAKEDRVIYFINYLNLLIEAGDDPATAEADIDIDAVNVLTIHKAKGLEFEAVFLVSTVMGRFPCASRRQTIELPEELLKDVSPSGDFHTQEERRLFYVGMTRAKKELYFTSASDYGGSRVRKVSQFVLEALGTKEYKAEAKKSSAYEAIQRHAPIQKVNEKSLLKDIGKEQVLSLSYYQIDDYRTCPLKYKFVHVLRVPIMEHHTVLYGKALHDCVQKYFQYKAKDIAINKDELIQSFLGSFKQEGFLDARHQEERASAGALAMERFFLEQEKIKSSPTYIEKEFTFMQDNNRVTGRWDMLYITDKENRIVDFKSSDVKKQVDADKKARESLQLSIYAMAFKHIFAKLPDWVELHFLESGLIGKAKRAESDLEKVEVIITEVSRGIRSRNFEAKPAYLACTYCAFSQICPSSVAGA